jgi:hypothetical protein
MKKRGWLSLKSFLAAQLWNISGSKVYLLLQIRFLTEVLGLLEGLQGSGGDGGR